MSKSLDNHLDVSALVEMGFSKERVEQALSATNHKGIQPAIEWLFSHAVPDPDSGQRLGNTLDDQGATKENKPTDTSAESESAAEPAKESESISVALSLVCDDCGKQLRSEMEVQAHAVRTGHQSFSESSEAVKPLTEEEKEEQKMRLQQKLEERRQQRLIEEKNQQKDRERVRRRTGKEISQAKEEHAHQEMRKIAEERRKEKVEEKRLRQKLKDQIAKDRADFKAKNEAAKSNDGKPSQTRLPQSALATTNTPTAKREYETCRIQFRLIDGSILNSSFKATDTLEDLHKYLKANRGDSTLPYTLSTTFPRKVLQDSDNSKTVKELNLVPASVLVVGKL